MLVLAGNARQFTRWCREHQIAPRDAIYADCIDRVRGLSPASCELVRVGTWPEHEQGFEMLNYLRARGFEPRDSLLAGVRTAVAVAPMPRDYRPDWAPRLTTGRVPR